MDVVFVGIIIFVVVGKLIDLFVRVLEKCFFKWRDSYVGEK